MVSDEQILMTSVPILAAALVAFGVVKGKMLNYVDYEAHRKICLKEREETTRINDKLFLAQQETRDMVKEIHGFLKAQNGGRL